MPSNFIRALAGFRPVALALLLLLPSLPAAAQVDPTPGGELTAADYQRAEAFLSGNLTSRLFRADLTPSFTTGDRFWYRVRVPGGFEFIQVDPARGTREPAFDPVRLAAALSAGTGQATEALQLPFSTLDLLEEGVAVEVTVEGEGWRCTLTDYVCTRTPPSSRPPSGVASPDGRYTAFRRDHDLWLHDREGGEEVRLTSDGADRYGYATDSQGWRRTDNPVLLWSPDSQRIATYRLDEREVEEMHLVRTAEPRPEHVAWPYALPSDSVVPMLERVVIHLDGPRVVRLEGSSDHQRTSSCCGLSRGQAWADVEWGAGGELAFVSVSRDYRTATLRVADPATGSVRTVLEESHPLFFESNVASGGVPNWRVLHGSGEFLWFSQRDGWGHLFLHDLSTGSLKNRITGGDWNVLDILRVDPSARTILFTAVGREAGEDPYHRQLYRVRMDGTGLTRLTSEPGDHDVTLTPSGDFFVDRVSTVATPPVITLRRTRDGSAVRTLEEADTSELEALGWTPPEPFRTRGRDGVTDIHGILIRPSHFNPSKRYPIVNAIYPGPQSGSVGTRSFSVSRRGQAHALAELGFIVVLVDAMGTPLRSKAFHTAYYGDMGDNGLPDQKAAMRELASRHPWIDLDRVGIYGHSGGGFATAAALLRHPDFFHVGVSGAGNHDNRGYTYYWGEKYHGPFTVGEDGVDSYTNQANHLLAEKLKGRLLLSYGSMDPNVHPNTTLLLVDALIAANKDFDLLVMPNRNHGYANESYAVRRTWDYFVRHLMGKEPPREYRLGG